MAKFRTLHVRKGTRLDGSDQYYELMWRHGDTSFVAHVFTLDGVYKYATVLSDAEVRDKWRDMTDEVYEYVVLDEA